MGDGTAQGQVGEDTGQEESHKGQDEVTGVKGPAQWAKGSGRHGTVVELVITSKSFLPSEVRGSLEGGTTYAPSARPTQNALLYLVRGPGPALMSLIGSTSRCYRWWHSRSPPSRRHSNRG